MKSAIMMDIRCHCIELGGRSCLSSTSTSRCRPARFEAFKAACVENSRNSLLEPGIARFDVLQQNDDPTRFLLVEVYRTAEAPAAHKQTAHYQKWAETVSGMMAAPRIQREVHEGLPGRRATMKFEFATAGRILFGSGSSEQLPSLARGLGDMALLVLGGSRRHGEAVSAGLDSLGVRSLIFSVDAEPTTHLVDEAAALARGQGCNLVIAVGGGSVIDAGKAVAAMLAHPGLVLDYLELVGGGKPLDRPCVPCIAVPTTAGTGAEVTRNSVLGVPEHQVKASLRSHYLLPRMAVIDPGALPFLAAGSHGVHWHGRADSTHRALCQQRGQPAHRRSLP